MAQLVERLVRNEEASGSNPLISTKPKNLCTQKVYIGFFFVPIKSAQRLAYGAAVTRLTAVAVAIAMPSQAMLAPYESAKFVARSVAI